MKWRAAVGRGLLEDGVVEICSPSLSPAFSAPPVLCNVDLVGTAQMRVHAAYDDLWLLQTDCARGGTLLSRMKRKRQSRRIEVLGRVMPRLSHRRWLRERTEGSHRGPEERNQISTELLVPSLSANELAEDPSLLVKLVYLSTKCPPQRLGSDRSCSDCLGLVCRHHSANVHSSFGTTPHPSSLWAVDPLQPGIKSQTNNVWASKGT